MPDSTSPLPFLQSGVAQVALLVPDLDHAVEAWWRDFGVGPWHFYTYQKPFVRCMSYRGQPANYAMRLALAWLGSLRVELIQPLRGPSLYHDFIERHGYGFHHLGLLVDDMPTALALARAAGFEMVMDGSGFGPDGDGHYAYLDTETRLGVTLELIQRPRRRRPPEKVYPRASE